MSGFHLNDRISNDAELEEVLTLMNIVDHWFNQWPHPNEPTVQELIALLLGETMRGWKQQAREYDMRKSRLPQNVSVSEDTT